MIQFLKGKSIDFKSKVWKGISHIVGQSKVKEEKGEEDNNNNNNNRDSNSINYNSQNNRASLEVPRDPPSNANKEEIASEFGSQSKVDYSIASNM